MWATDGNSQTLRLRDGAARWPDSALIVASIVFALAIGVFLSVRRLSGAFSVPLPATQLVATAAGLCMWAAIVRLFAANHQVLLWLPLCAVSFFAVGCSYPGNRLVDWLVWLPAIGIVLWSPMATRFTKRHPTFRRSLQSEEQDAPGEQVLQEVKRVRTTDGKDTIRGTVVAEFASGERQATVYVGFCPPFELLPDVELDVADGSEVDIKLAQVLHNGAQIDVRLNEPAEKPIAVAIEFFAVQGG